MELHLTGFSSTLAPPIGACPDCGCMRYAGLVHHCSTSLKPGQVAAAQQPLVIPLRESNGSAAALPVGWTFGSGATAAAA